MDDIIQKLQKSGFKGDIDTSDEARQFYSHDASIFEMKPQVVVHPKEAEDIERLVTVTAANKTAKPDLSLTARAAGTDMSGGAINNSIIVDFAKYFTRIESVTAAKAQVQPGVLYKDFEVRTLKHGALMPSFPSSREYCTVGGMVSNNAGGEKSLQYGSTINFVTQLTVVFADGKEYAVKPLNRRQLVAKMAQKDFEGRLYKKTFQLIEAHYDQIKQAKPKVTKNTTGYNLWDVWDRQTGVFDLTKLIVGSQGTLGLITDITFRLVPNPKYSGTLICFLKNTKELGGIVNTVLQHSPATFESFDNYTLNSSLKYFAYFRSIVGWWGLLRLGLQLIPDAVTLFRRRPKFVLLIEFTGDSQEDVNQKIAAMHRDLELYKIIAMEEGNTPAKAWKFRIMRRESFNILRQKVKNKHTAPFIDDIVVPPEHLPEFLPQLRRIINKYRLLATVSGHMGDGNFHVIPLMRLETIRDRHKLAPAMHEVNDLVLKYGGSTAGEHNDGLVRGHWLVYMYGPKMLEIFKKTKRIFDPANIFNPHKKTDAKWEYSAAHIRQHFDK